MKIQIQAVISAPIEIVWRSFNEPADILLWDASKDWRTTKASNDLRVGGLLQLHIEPRHGGAGFDFTATYTRIDAMEFIGWRTDAGHRVSVEFRKTGAGVIIYQTFDAEPEPTVDEQRQDWQGVLDNFARYVTATAG